MTTVAEAIAKPLSVAGVKVSGSDIARVIDELANAAPRFTGMDLCGPLPSFHSFHWQQEVMNRLLQRWRKLGLMEFKAGYWTLTRGAWDQMQRAATAQRGEGAGS